MQYLKNRWIGGLPRYLAEIQNEIESYAKEFNLDFYPTFFEVLNYDQMNEIAAYGGFPTRYPHWRFGMEYDRLRKSSTYGLSKIYEMVINNNPCTAYLLEGNSTVDQKLVMAHVFAHCDFFKNNLWFAHTNRRMIDEMANHGAKVRKYMNRYGQEKVEEFIDLALSIDNLIDIHNPPLSDGTKNSFDTEDKEDMLGPGDVPRIKAKPYMDKYINPPEFIKEQRQKIKEANIAETKFPINPARDVLGFLLEHAPLKHWQRGVLEIIREEAYYFAPQGQTKIMNEGWATFWHSRIMTEKALNASEIVDYADHASMVTATSGKQLNPYKLGVELYKHIVDRWNKGRFGKQWDNCTDMSERASWDKNTGLGLEKIFQIRKTHNDITFIDEFLTHEFVIDQKLFSFGYNPRRKEYQIESREFNTVKQKLLSSLTNMGHPTIEVLDANYQNAGQLLLRHEHRGVDLDPSYTQAVLRNIFALWKKNVALSTRDGNKKIIATFDGTEFSETPED